MTYTVKRNGQMLFLHTEHEKCRPDATQEAQMQEAECDIYVDGKKLRKVKKNGT